MLSLQVQFLHFCDCYVILWKKLLIVVGMSHQRSLFCGFLFIPGGLNKHTKHDFDIKTSRLLPTQHHGLGHSLFEGVDGGHI